MADTPEFVQRILFPEKYPYIDNKDGTFSTHKMMAEVDEKGNWIVFPSIVLLPDGTLYEFKDPYEAMKYNIRTKNYLPMKSKEEALNYSKGGYKKGTPLEKFNPLKNRK